MEEKYIIPSWRTVRISQVKPDRPRSGVSFEPEAGDRDAHEGYQIYNDVRFTSKKREAIGTSEPGLGPVAPFRSLSDSLDARPERIEVNGTCAVDQGDQTQTTAIEQAYYLYPQERQQATSLTGVPKTMRAYSLPPSRQITQMSTVIPPHRQEYVTEF